MPKINLFDLDLSPGNTIMSSEPTVWKHPADHEETALEVIYMGVTQAEAFQPLPGDVCVSISDYGRARAKLNDGWDEVIYAETETFDPKKDLLQVRMFCMKILVPLMKRPVVKRLIVHCTYGEVRSRTVAGVFSELLGAKLYHLPAHERRKVVVFPAAVDKRLGETMDNLLYRALSNLKRGRPAFDEKRMQEMELYFPITATGTP